MIDEAPPAAEDAMEAHLIACINESLAAFLYDNACFLCERLVASSQSPVSALLTEATACCIEPSSAPSQKTN